MTKKFFKAMTVAVFANIAGYNVYLANAENGNVVSDLLMANVEALSQSENNDDKIYCCGNVGTCMIVYDSSFNRKEVVGLKFSTPCP